jgi:predicted double-glycine peptidase
LNRQTIQDHALNKLRLGITAGNHGWKSQLRVNISIMVWEAIATVLLGTLAFFWGCRLGNQMVRRGATANDLFSGNKAIACLVIALCAVLMAVAIYLPQWQALPIPWRSHGLRVSWTTIRVLLLGACGITFAVSRKTARSQVLAVLLFGLLGLVGFSATEAYFLAPIHSQLSNNLQRNGVYKQTSDSSCAPSALATLRRYWGLDTATESTMARGAGTSRMGTTMPQLIQAVRGLGMNGLEFTESNWEQLRRVNRPGILAVWLIDGRQKLPHAVALMAMNQEEAFVADPARGRIYNLSRQEFQTLWRAEYVPIFRPDEVMLTQHELQTYLGRSGFWREGDSLKGAIRQFQTFMGLKPTGELNTKTTLLLSGPYLKVVPTLNVDRFLQTAMTRMNCLNQPDRCPW